MPKLVRLSLCVGLLLPAACLDERPVPAPAPVYAADIEALLKAKCERCHNAEDAQGGYRVDSYLGVLGCPDSSPELRAIDEGDQGRPILEVLSRSDHDSLLDADQKARLRAWVKSGAPLRGDGGVHAAGILDPRSPDWHGKLAAQDRFGPLLDADHRWVCGRCHAGAPVTPRGVKHPAPNAPDCTSCHTQPEGVLACGTCHGDGAQRASPPRDACAFGVGEPEAHHAHLESTRLWPHPLQCNNCHPAADAQLQGTHADGTVDVRFDHPLAGDDASYDADTGQCAVGCHNQGGARTRPSFHETEPMQCGDCHGAPPKDHYAGPCDKCHADANADGTALTSVELHLDGKIELGNASGNCAACHGQGDDPMPRTPSHLLHRNTALTSEIVCGDCHKVPDKVDSPGHLDKGEVTGADVVFGARASARGQTPTYEDGTCREVACHGAGLPDGEARTFKWDAPADGQCSSCHGLPPSKNHPADSGCASLTCHGNEVSFGQPRAITPSGRELHIDGKFEAGER